MTYSPPLCKFCDNYRGNDKKVCLAYPDGIPDEIYFEGGNHKKPFKGDNGIQFKLSDNENKRKDYYFFNNLNSWGE